MSFQPTIPLTGIPGWKFLERTQPVQQKAFENAPQIKRDIEYFEANIGKVKTAADLVADRRLLNVALGAFGLEGEIDKKAFLRTILEGGTDDPNSLANRLIAKGMKDFARAFGFGNAGGSQIGKPGFTATIVTAYKTRGFETAVGNANDDLRLAMNFKREITELSDAGLRKVFDTVPQVTSETDYFTAKIGAATTPAKLVDDPRLLKVALTAFGLEGELARPAFIRQALEGGTEKADSIANRSEIPRLKEFVQVFGYGDKVGAQTAKAGFGVRIVADYKTQSFGTFLADAAAGKPAAVALRNDLALKSTSERGAWYSVLGSKPLRSVFEAALNLPKEFARLDIDRQHTILVEGAKKLTGSDKITAFADPKTMEKLINRFLVMSQINANAANNSPAQAALSLLRSAKSNSQGMMNLLASRG